MDPEGVLQRISGTLDQMINKVKTEMLQNRGEGPEWEKDTISNAESLLIVLNDAVTETIADELIPDGCPQVNNERVDSGTAKTAQLILHNWRETR